MISPTPWIWRRLGDRIEARLASSYWRLPALLVGALAAVLGPLWLVRGQRGVRLGVGGLVAATCGLVSFAFPFPTLLLTIFVLLSNVDLFLPGPIGVLLLAVVLARLVYDLICGARLDWGSTPFRIACAALLMAILASLAGTRSLDLAAIELRNLVVGGVLFAAVSLRVQRPSQLVAVVVTLALAAAFTSLMAIHRLLAGGTEALALTLAMRFGSLGGDPNVHAGQVNCILPMLAAAIPFLRGRYRLALIPVLLLLIGSVIVSQSRAGMVILVLVLLGLLLRSGRHARALMAITAVVLAVVLLWLPRIYWVRFVSIGQLTGIVVDRSLLLRQHAMQTAWQVFVDHPLFGVGLGTLGQHSPRHMLGTFVAHNSFLEVAATLGVVGLAAYAAWLWTGFGMARRAAARWAAAVRPRERALAQSVAFAILVYCATAMFLSIQFYPFFLLLLGLANAARRGAPAEPQGAAAPGS